MIRIPAICSSCIFWRAQFPGRKNPVDGRCTNTKDSKRSSVRADCKACDHFLYADSPIGARFPR